MQSRVMSVEPEQLTQTSALEGSPPLPAEFRRQEAKVALVGTPSGWPMRLTFLISDALSLACSCLVSLVLTSLLRGTSILNLSPLQFPTAGILYVSLIGVAFSLGSYSPIPPRPARQFRGWGIGALCASVGLVASLWILGLGSISLSIFILLAAFLSLFQAAFQRALCRMKFGKKDWWGTRFIVVGDGKEAAQAFERMRVEPQWGLRAVGIVAEDETSLPKETQSFYLGHPCQIDDIAQKFQIIRAIFIAHWFDSEENALLVTQGTPRIRQWIALPAPMRFPSLWLDSCEVARHPGWAIRRHLAMPTLLVIKRISDFIMTGCIGVALLPLVLLLAALVKLTSKGPVFFGQRRIGCDGKHFIAWKFRTMHPDADRLLTEHLALNPHLAAEWEANHKLKADPRVTWIGRILRSTSLDELPQLWNVLVGEMSLVGPRPIVDAEVEKYRDAYELYRKVKPGITGLWQVSGRNNTTYDERVELDTYYVHNWSIWLDFYILACTVKVVLLGEGAY
jgi:Undecaprenyl-phosphate galactose phosphotransferase WbaP